MNNKTFNYASFVAANAGRNVSKIDYLNAIYKTQEIPEDFIITLSELFSPEFKAIDDVVFISALFDQARFERMVEEGHSLKSIQYWLNLLEITELFNDPSSDDAYTLATSISRSWNAKLTEEFGATAALARPILDEETGEVFVTIGSP